MVNETTMGTKTITNYELGLLEHISLISTNLFKVAGIGEETSGVKNYYTSADDSNIAKGAKMLKLDEKKSVKEVLSVFDEVAINKLIQHGDKLISGGDLTGKEWAAVIRSIQNNEKLCNLIVIDNQIYGGKHNIQTCYAVAKDNWINKDKPECIITYKCTSGNEEWVDDFEGINVKHTERQLDALAFYERSTKKFKENFKSIYGEEVENNDIDVSLVGHSKGANKAMYVSVVAGLKKDNEGCPIQGERNASNNILRCIGFNGQGFSKEFISAFMQEIEENNAKIVNYATEFDFVNNLLSHFENIQYSKDFTKERKISVSGRLNKKVKETCRAHSLIGFYDAVNEDNGRPCIRPATDFELVDKQAKNMTVALSKHLTKVLDKKGDKGKEKAVNRLSKIMSPDKSKKAKFGAFLGIVSQTLFSRGTSEVVTDIAKEARDKAKDIAKEVGGVVSDAAASTVNTIKRSSQGNIVENSGNNGIELNNNLNTPERQMDRQRCLAQLRKLQGKPSYGYYKRLIEQSFNVEISTVSTPENLGNVENDIGTTSQKWVNRENDRGYNSENNTVTNSVKYNSNYYLEQIEKLNNLQQRNKF